MSIIILKYAVKQLQEMKNPSFYIIENNNGAIVDFAESSEDANSKCMFADSNGIKCTFYETSVKTIEMIRESVKDADLDPMKGDSLMIPNLDLEFIPE